MTRLAPELAREIAALLVARGAGPDLAFLRQRDTVYFAEGRDEVRSAAVVLIQGIYAALPRDAHFIVRNTIHATREPGAFTLGMVKVAARRLRVVEPALPGTDSTGDREAAPREFQEVRFDPDALPALRTFDDPSMSEASRAPRALSHEDWLRFAEELVPPSSPELPLHARDRRVGAALVSPAGELLAASANTNGANRTLHAELNVLMGSWLATGAKLSPGTRLYATLRPCKMCAGLLWDLSREPGTVSVHFAEDDPGSAARNTVLCPGSPMRARFARTPAELAAPGCTALRVGATERLQ